MTTDRMTIACVCGERMHIHETDDSFVCSACGAKESSAQAEIRLRANIVTSQEVVDAEDAKPAAAEPPQPDPKPVAKPVPPAPKPKPRTPGSLGPARLLPPRQAPAPPPKPVPPPTAIMLVRFARPITLAAAQPSASISNCTHYHANKHTQWTAKIERYGIALRRADGGGTTVPWSNIECWDDNEIKPEGKP